MTNEIDKSPPLSSSHGCCGGKGVRDSAATVAAKAETAKPKPESEAASCCGSATPTDGAKEQAPQA